jgi:hypothetical protein
MNPGPSHGRSFGVDGSGLLWFELEGLSPQDPRSAAGVNPGGCARPPLTSNGGGSFR